MSKSIKAIDKASIHQITSGQVVIDLQNAIKELLENSIDAGATNVEIRFNQYGFKSIDVVDNGSGIAEEDHGSIALKHHTSKLDDISDLTKMSTFGFRGEALSSLCALCEEVTITTATSSATPMGTCLIMDSTGNVKRKSKVARQQGTTVTLTNLFSSLPVRRKEFQRNIKREYGKALSLLTAYALGPCATSTGVRLAVSNQPEKGQKTVQIKTLGSTSSRSSMTTLWGPKALDNIIDMDVSFEVEQEKSVLKRLKLTDSNTISVRVKGLISKFAVGCGRTGTDRQFFYVNGRPFNTNTIQKAFNEVYRSFNANQAPFILADFIIPTDAYDVNVSPDKRTILIHNENNLITELKATLEAHFSTARSTYDVDAGTQRKTKTWSLSQLNQKSESATSTKDGNLVQRGSHEHGDQGPHLKPSSIPSFSLDPSSNTPSPSGATKDGPPLSQESLESEPCLGPSSDGRTASSSLPDMEPTLIQSMDVDEDEGHDSAIVMNTSQTTWARQLGTEVRSRSESPLRVSPVEEVPVDASTDQGPAKKKRKSEVDFVGREESTVIDDIDQTTNRRTMQNSSLRQSSIKQFVSSSNLRKQLASFALPGSQLSTSALSSTIETMEEAEDEPIAEEVDELEEQNPPNEKACSDFDKVDDGQDSQQTSSSNNAEAEIPDSFKGLTDIDDDETDDPTSVLSQARATSSTTPCTISHKDRVGHPEIIKTDKSGADVFVRLDVKKIKRLWLQHQDMTDQQTSAVGKESISVDAGVLNAEDDEKAVSALSRVIEKQDFEKMAVVGQFNLGFIIVRRRQRDPHEMDDLFIVDQHAADEKYNFETLQATTKIESQKLFRSQHLELTVADEMLAFENIDVIRQNGFEIDLDDSVEHGRRLKLLAIPVSKGTVFDVKDLEEIVHLMRDRPTGQMVRCSKAQSMFASRACRKSVMIGMPLTQSQMATVIRHMGTMDQPWNCPHGRPTMRHLSDLRWTGLRCKEKIDWSTF